MSSRVTRATISASFLRAIIPRAGGSIALVIAASHSGEREDAADRKRGGTQCTR
jgi:hypothetical protein